MGKPSEELRREGCRPDLIPHRTFDGNRPSLSLLVPKVRANVPSFFNCSYNLRGCQDASDATPIFGRLLYSQTCSIPKMRAKCPIFVEILVLQTRANAHLSGNLVLRTRANVHLFPIVIPVVPMVRANIHLVSISNLVGVFSRREPMSIFFQLLKPFWFSRCERTPIFFQLLSLSFLRCERFCFFTRFSFFFLSG